MNNLKISNNGLSFIVMLCCFSITLLSSLNAYSSVKSNVADTAITTKVKALLIAEPDLSGFDIKVTTNHGIVSLEGNLDTSLQLHRAIEIASRVKGVFDVHHSRLGLNKKAENPGLDAIISAKAYGRIGYLEFNKLINPNYFLRVETYDRVLHIWGYLKNDKDKKTIINYLNEIKDLKEIKTNIVYK